MQTYTNFHDTLESPRPCFLMTVLRISFWISNLIESDCWGIYKNLCKKNAQSSQVLKCPSWFHDSSSRTCKYACRTRRKIRHYQIHSNSSKKMHRKTFTCYSHVFFVWGNKTPRISCFTGPPVTHSKSLTNTGPAPSSRHFLL